LKTSSSSAESVSPEVLLLPDEMVAVIPNPITNPTLFHNQFWSSSRPAAVLMELGLTSCLGGPVDIVHISEEQLKTDPTLTALNPQKRLPFFYDPSADLKLNESGGLVQYLLEKYDPNHKLWPAPNDPTRAEFLKLVHFGPATAYHVAVPILFHFMPPKGMDPTPLKELETKKKEWHTVVAPTLEQALDKYGGPYLLGDKFSAADLVCGYDLMTISFTGNAAVAELLGPHPKVKAYLDIISKRDVYKKLYSVPGSEPVSD
jgi:glutathione S-transferase